MWTRVGGGLCAGIPGVAPRVGALPTCGGLRAGGRRSVLRSEGGGGLLPAEASLHLFELKPSDC